MKNTLCGLALLFGLLGTAQAEDWTGKLIDATCSDQQEKEKTVSCDATGTTTVFALNVSGKIYKLDAGGSSKAAAALKYRANPGPGVVTVPSIGLKAMVTGTEAGGMIMVESIGLQ